MTAPAPAPASQRLHEAAWPEMVVNLQTAYAELTQAQAELETRAAEVEEARDFLQQVLESMSEALFLMDRAGRVVRTNRAAGALLGRAEKELIGKPFAEVVGTDAIPATPWRLLERAPGGTLTNLDVEVRTRQGRSVPVSVSCNLVRDQRGKITGVLAVARDVTDRKEAEEALTRQAQELARSNADLDQFAYVASHDLKEPLRTVVGHLQRLEKRCKDQLDERAFDSIGKAMQGARAMYEMIENLHVYSRVGRQGAPAPTDCTAVLQAARASLQAALDESGTVLTSDPLPAVLAVEWELVRLFQNLIGNAVKFRGDRPVEVHVGARRQGQEWLLWVRDNGIGIERQYWERIFGFGERIHSRAKYAGTGFGLAFCKKIVERNGGRIWVESEPDQGSTFWFTLPAASPP